VNGMDKVKVSIENQLHTSLSFLQDPELCSGSGWVCLPGALVKLEPGDPWPQGEILSAERTLGDGSSRSVHLRATDGGWVFTRILEESTGPDGHHDLADSIDYISSFDPSGCLRYRRYFRGVLCDGVPVYRPLAARFAGFFTRGEG